MTTQAMSAAVLPLHRIRQVEAECARLIASAHREAEAAVAASTAQSESVVAQAREEGRREGERLCAESVAAAQRRSDALIAEARRLESDRCRCCLPLTDAAAAHVVDCVLGTGGHL